MQEKYLTIHGHFYQPPRENPWLEVIEIQDSARPFHNWNERISMECYEPNSVARIVDDKNKILSIINNYQYMSFNMGPTLLAWMEKYAPQSYRRIIDADKNSISVYNGHGCAIAQVYNHIIMPLANHNDKYTQAIWGIKDFEKRFGRKPEGIWLAETAADASTLEVLANLGIKFTILSPYQAQCVRKIGEKDWHDVSWGSIDPSQPYRYFVEGTDKYIDLFFYDGAISKSVAFDNLLVNGEKFAYRLQDGYVQERNRPQLVNIATDGESYGHHTKFGDMALSYVLAIKAKELGFQVTNYGEFLEKFKPQYEVDIKTVSSWSCIHGVQRWCDDCGCSTGAQSGWNQKWRKPLREALDYLRDELIKICAKEGAKYYKDFWEARNNYIDVVLDRTSENVDNFLKKNASKKLTRKEKINAIKLMEIQRFAMLMYTSCGWFFAEISGIETTQIMKYALRAMELAYELTNINLEDNFLTILQRAKSNVPQYENGKKIYEMFVKPSRVTVEKIVTHWAISSLYSDNSDMEEIYCYKIKKINYRVHKNAENMLAFGHIEVTSEITFEKFDITFALLKTSESEYYCTVCPFESQDKFSDSRKNILEIFEHNSLLGTLDKMKKEFSPNYYTIKDVLIDKRKIILEQVLVKRLLKTEKTYRELYEDLRAPVSQLALMGMDIPDVFRIAAKFCLLKDLDETLENAVNFLDEELNKKLDKIKEEAQKFYINLNKSRAKYIIAKKLQKLLENAADNPNEEYAQKILAVFGLIDKLGLEVDIRVSQNIYYEKIYSKIDYIIEYLENSKDKAKDRRIILLLLEIGKQLNINTDFYVPMINRAALPDGAYRK
ncbi:MAG: DUF3536 domain-containing protein [Candidatus Gastranaerophilales bacterium]|nr:DUF3536 domain-containing protein [Candidatus Gastranaerophilales bacterium]